ncbi:uncharacterized protein F5891DRAFT_1185660 [Suillus fuscotomentosus]|uniref:DUF6532 domain-containing protein n=1 Tax=Suillus fuscotomentosus TaxID=1912939 RepID=A0AAD4HNQ0_9AGAM|nr:uncharacterized protein F5891DRAFT_1185660 [Suillus fuscotomentosus]KAG1903011.1 hypothetical protein F5891DRAFT_1185660 [Suillus fuscotomentosus]
MSLSCLLAPSDLGVPMICYTDVVYNRWGGICRCEKQLMKDLKYVHALSLVPEGHIGGIHENIRKAVQAHVASHYGLMKGADERVTDLLKNNAYIYPANTKDAFFNDKLAVGVKWHGHLTSTFEDHPDKAELPVAMVVLASTVVCSIIMQYSTDFNSEIVLNGIFKASKCKYHVFMHSLYKTVYGSKRKTEEPDAADSLMFLDIEGMVEE